MAHTSATMEEGEIEMTTEELQKYIRGIVKTRLISTDTLEKCELLQSLLEKREKQSAHLLRLCESVAACEAVVKKQYSLLGWEYRDTDSDDDDDDDADIAGFGNTSPSPCDFVHDVTQVPSSPTPSGCSSLSPMLGNSENVERNDVKQIINLKKQPVVVLTRIPLTKIRSLCPPTPLNHDSEDESLNPPTPERLDGEDEYFDPPTRQKHDSEDESSSDSDNQWEPDDDSSDSDYSISSYNTGSNKRRKIDQKNEAHAKSHATPQASRKTGAESKPAKTSTPQASAINDAKSNKMKTSTANTNGISPASTVSTVSQSSTKATKTKDRPSAIQQKIRVNMNVLARRKAMDWKRGKLVEIVTKEDGRLKYMISFKEKGQSLVSGHHIAFDCIPKADQLFVGARVVVKCEAEKPLYCPGFVAELPSRKNRMRFLVFMDDHTPIYVALPSLHLVCRPLADPFEDILDEVHKAFMKDYVKVWPYPPQTHYKVGQKVNAELNGVQQRCEVKVVDCSLIQVDFLKNQHTEWIYRGSIRLEHMFNVREKLDLIRVVSQKKDQLQMKIESTKSTH